MACGQDKAIVKEMDEKAIAIHDEVMPKMKEIIDLKGEIKAKIAGLDSLSTEKQTLESAYEALATGEEGMREWMRNYQKPDFKKSLEELKPVAEFQLQAIEKVKVQMESSIADAKGLLGK
jgi:hypothetical protein